MSKIIISNGDVVTAEFLNNIQDASYVYTSSGDTVEQALDTLETDLVTTNNAIDAIEASLVKPPLVILALGQSNMRGFFAANGGDETIESGVYMWNTDATDNAALVAGTAFYQAAWGTAPLNILNGSANAQLLSLHTANNLHRKTGRDIYVVQIAAGGHSVEAFITGASLATNGWTRPGADQDLSAFLYPGAADALALVPGNRGKYDAVIYHQGEANSVDGVELYANKLRVLFNELTAAFLDEQTIIAVGELAQSGGNVNVERHGYSLVRFCEVVPAARIIKSAGVPITASNSLHFSGVGIVELGRRFADGLLSQRIEYSLPDPVTQTLPFTTTGLGGFTFIPAQAELANRAAIPVTNVVQTFDTSPLLGSAFKVPASTSSLLYTRNVYRVKDNKLIRISYTIDVDDAAGSVDHRAVVYQYDKDMAPVAALVSVPPSSPSAGTDGRVFVTRTYQRNGAALGADTTLAAGVEFVSLGVWTGFGADDEAHYFNIMELDA